MTHRYQAPSIKKAFQILKLISGADQGLGISALASDLGISKSTVHGITLALEEMGTIIRDPLTKRYALGLTLFELGRSAYSQIDVRDLARPVMEELMEKAQESVFLGALNGDHVTVLDIVESRQDLKITSPIGTTIPLPAGATAKVFLGLLGEKKAREIIRKKGLNRYTENTITDPGEYMAEINRVRENGYATDYEEYIPGVRAIVSPIAGKRHSVSAIWIVGFKTSLDDHKMNTLVGATKAAAEKISRKIMEQPFV
jgi:DNA-binding IclR family transcriptional regulator